MEVELLGKLLILDEKDFKCLARGGTLIISNKKIGQVELAFENLSIEEKLKIVEYYYNNQDELFQNRKVRKNAKSLILERNININGMVSLEDVMKILDDHVNEMKQKYGYDSLAVKSVDLLRFEYNDILATK